MTQAKGRLTYDVLYKILVLGEHGVGKTNLVSRYKDDTFTGDMKTTLGVDFCSHKVTIEGESVVAQLWDTAGAEQFKSLNFTFYKGAYGAMLVYDITKKSTFVKLLDLWMHELKENADKEVMMILVGNKCDLHTQREVPKKLAEEFAESIKIPFMETSAKDSINVDVAFNKLLHNIYDLKHEKVLKEYKKEEPTSSPKKGKKVENKEGEQKSTRDRTFKLDQEVSTKKSDCGC